VTGHVTVLTYADRAVGPQDLVSIHENLQATAGGNVVRFNNVGIDLVRIEPDGTAILMIVGIAPFRFTGVQKIDLTTGEVILEPQHSLDTTRACSLLTR